MDEWSNTISIITINVITDVKHFIRSLKHIPVQLDVKLVIFSCAIEVPYYVLAISLHGRPEIHISVGAFEIQIFYSQFMIE